MRSVLVLLSFIFTPLLALAATDTSNASDYPNITRLPGSYIVKYENKTADYRLILGGLRKINGVLAPEKEERLNGDVFQITYRIPEQFSAQDAFTSFEKQISALGAEVLFECAGRDCGSSNKWANNIFRYSRLYGVDSTQSFASYRLDNQYYSLYAVQRGNKRVYLRLEVLVAAPLGFKTLLEQGHGVVFTERKGELLSLAEYLNENPKLRLWLVGIDVEDGSKQQQLDRAYEAANGLKADLVEKGIDSDRISLHSLGNFIAGQATGISIYIE